MLACPPTGERERLRPHFETGSLRHWKHIIPDEPIIHSIFSLNCLLSLVTMMEDGAVVESGTIGREVMAGFPAILDAGRTTTPTFVQVPGETIKVRTEFIKEAYERSGEVRRLFNRYIHTVIVNGSQSAACKRLHNVEQRFCMWLLISSDGTSAGEVALTHEVLAVMLGVRRAGVAEAAVKTQAAGLMSYKRGRIQILDRGVLRRHPASVTAGRRRSTNDCSALRRSGGRCSPIRFTHQQRTSDLT